MFRGDLVMGIACTALQKDGDPRVDNSIGTLGRMVGSHSGRVILGFPIQPIILILTIIRSLYSGY